MIANDCIGLFSTDKNTDKNTETDKNLTKKMGKISLSLSTKTDARGKAQVLMRFIGGQYDIYRGKTGIYVKPQNWHDGRPRAAHRDQADYAEVRKVQRQLDALADLVCDRYNKDKAHGKEWLKDLLANVRWDSGGELVSSSRTDFAQMGITASQDTMITELVEAKMIAKSTSLSYITVRNRVEAFEKAEGECLVADFDASAFNRLLSFVRRAYKLSDNTIHDFRVRVLRWWHWCQEKDATLPAMPRNVGKVRAKAYGTPYYLTKEQRDRLYKAKIRKHNDEVARDVFVFQCLIGCRVSDLKTLTEANVKGDNIEYVAKKTMRSNPQTITVPLHPIAKEIIGKYKGRQKTLLPVPEKHDTYHDRLRRAIKEAGIDCMITIRDSHTGEARQVMLSEVASSHMARRTFVGCLYEAGFRESDICSMSGHREGSLSIQRYRRVSDERKRMMIDSI